MVCQVANPKNRLRPVSLVSFIGFGLLFFSVAVYVDTAFYRPSASFGDILHAPIITPINNLLYNSDSSNLALHGLHPHYQHFLANLPQLLGPAYVMMVLSFWSLPTIPSWLKDIRAVSALSATMLLSIFPHQEPRFLIPCVPLLLSCFRLRKSRLFLAAWVIFNASLGFLMGVYHQGGIVPAQIAIPAIVSANTAVPNSITSDPLRVSAAVFWWKTYSPPLWLLGDNTHPSVDLETRDLMGISGPDMIEELERSLPFCPLSDKGGAQKPDAVLSTRVDSVFMVAPKSATFLDAYVASPTAFSGSAELELHEVWSYSNHINLDDLDFGGDGIIPTLQRVIGRRGLAVWAVRRACNRVSSNS